MTQTPKRTVAPGHAVRGAARPLAPADISAYWDAAAPTFDVWRGDAGVTASGHTAGEARAWKLLWHRVLGPPPARVLDVGCGTGSMVLLLASFGYEVVGVDASAPMLTQARRKADAAGLKVELHVADASSLPFPDGHFDATVAKLVLWTMLDPEAAVTDWRRCTRPGGQVAAIDISYDRLGPLALARLRLARATTARRSRAEAGYFHDPARLVQLPLWMAGAEAYRNVFVRSGLDRVLVEHLTGLAALERRRLPPTSRLWPVLTRHLVQGTVPTPARTASPDTTPDPGVTSGPDTPDLERNNP
ncbi:MULTISPECIES: class I SAM-dependent methyltransferase [Parafrankia]|uniref:class I SAM-dependent methyltransferase n=1 Tax=Parafrankia TaxID=2994362 RepID=UPI0034D5B393